MRLPSFTRTLLALAALLLSTGCKPKLLDLSPQISATLGERTIIAQLPNPARIETENGVATLFSGSHRIAVGLDRVLLDDKELVKLPTDAKNVTLLVSPSGTLTVSADFRAIATTPFPK